MSAPSYVSPCGRVALHLGDCLDVLRSMPSESADSLVTDPPYGLRFMGRKWDYDVPRVEVWEEALRVLKPGGHALIACGTRTQHRMAVHVEDAGFEIRDVVSWLYGSGFPKSANVSKMIDKAAGAEREVVGNVQRSGPAQGFRYDMEDLRQRIANGEEKTKDGRCVFKAVEYAEKGSSHPITAPATDAAKQWDGWGTALKPACEFFTLARKPLSEGTISANVLKHGTGGINVDGCRVGTDGGTAKGSKPKGDSHGIYGTGINGACEITDIGKGRWPANVILTHAPGCVCTGTKRVRSAGGQCGGADPGMWAGKKQVDISRYADADGLETVEAWQCVTDGSCPVQVLDAQSGETVSTGGRPKSDGKLGLHGWRPSFGNAGGLGDTGGASRFFYCAKANKRDRNEGLPDGVQSGHPCVKPTALMRYLCRLITPPGGTVIDPFMGSGSTGKAAVLEGFRFIGIDREAEYLAIARARIDRELIQGDLFLRD